MIDSFSVDPVSETLMPKYSKMILESYLQQERLKRIRKRRKIMHTGTEPRIKSR